MKPRDKMREAAWARLTSMRAEALAVMREAAGDARNPKLQRQAKEYLRGRGLIDAGGQNQSEKSGDGIPTHEVTDL
jgi:hypothetical protein